MRVAVHNTELTRLCVPQGNHQRLKMADRMLKTLAVLVLRIVRNWRDLQTSGSGNPGKQLLEGRDD